MSTAKDVGNSTAKRKIPDKDSGEKFAEKNQVGFGGVNYFAMLVLHYIVQTKKTQSLQLPIVALFAFVNARWRKRPVAPLSLEMLFTIGIACISYTIFPMLALVSERLKISPHYMTVPCSFVYRCLATLGSCLLLTRSKTSITYEKLEKKRLELENPTISVVQYQANVATDFYKKMASCRDDPNWPQVVGIMFDQLFLLLGWYSGSSFGDALSLVLTPVLFEIDD